MSIVFAQELRELINMHASKRDGNEEPLTYDEVLIVKVTAELCEVYIFSVLRIFLYHAYCNPQSALDMKDKTVKDAMTPIEAVFMLDCNDFIDTHTRDQVSGHTLFPTATSKLVRKSHCS